MKSKLKLIINKTRINALGETVILRKCKLPLSTVTNHAWLIAIEMPNGQKIAAYPGSSLFHLSPPSFYITDDGCDDSVHNKAPVHVIVKKLRKYCDDPLLGEAAKYLKRAVMAVSK